MQSFPYLVVLLQLKRGEVAKAKGEGKKEKECTTECKNRRRRDEKTLWALNHESGEGEGDAKGRRRGGEKRSANQPGFNSFRYKRAAFYSGIKGTVGLIFAKAAALRININTDGSPVAMGRTHITHTSHASRLLSSSLLITSSFPAPVCN